jgi:hypothetical protein
VLGARGLTPVRGDQVADGQPGACGATGYLEAASVLDGIGAQSPGDAGHDPDARLGRRGSTGQCPGLARVHRAGEGDGVRACQGRAEWRCHAKFVPAAKFVPSASSIRIHSKPVWQQMIASSVAGQVSKNIRAHVAKDKIT